MNKLARNTLALGTATLIVTAGLSFSANGADKIVAQGEASAITATGLTQIVDTTECRVESTGAPTNGTGPVCDIGLRTQGVGVFGQNAFTGLDGDKGTSTALAAVAPINIPTLKTIDLSTIPTDLSTIDTGTVLDPLIGGLGPVLTQTLNTLLAAAGLTLDEGLEQRRAFGLVGQQRAGHALEQRLRACRQHRPRRDAELLVVGACVVLGRRLGAGQRQPAQRRLGELRGRRRRQGRGQGRGPGQAHDLRRLRRWRLRRAARPGPAAARCCRRRGSRPRRRARSTAPCAAAPSA